IAGSYMCSGLTAYSALRKVEAHGRKGPVMIVGLGGVGLMGLQFAKAVSQREILAADIDAAKRETASALGASGLFDPAAEDARKAVLKATGGGVAAAVDFAGTQSSLHFAQSIVGKGGIVVVVGLMGGSFTLPAPMFPLRALTVSGSYVGSLQEAIDMLEIVRAGKVQPIPVETRPLAEANRCLDELRNGSVIGRVVLTP
ncbi:MAG: alcohol dehydrogenase, partial [Alphaproteobacteria bacterium]